MHRERIYCVSELPYFVPSLGEAFPNYLIFVSPLGELRESSTRARHSPGPAVIGFSGNIIHCTYADPRRLAKRANRYSFDLNLLFVFSITADPHGLILSMRLTLKKSVESSYARGAELFSSHNQNA
jgi:hypothetical protein